MKTRFHQHGGLHGGHSHLGGVVTMTSQTWDQRLSKSENPGYASGFFKLDRFSPIYSRWWIGFPALVILLCPVLYAGPTMRLSWERLLLNVFQPFQPADIWRYIATCCDMSPNVAKCRNVSSNVWSEPSLNIFLADALQKCPRHSQINASSP